MAQKSTFLHLYPPDLKRRLISLPPAELKEWLSEDKKLLADKNFRQLIMQSPQSILAREIYKKLLLGAVNALRKKQFKPALAPYKVAQLLAWLAHCKKSRLPWAVEVGLDWLGISRVSRTRGRPLGRKADLEYVAFVRAALGLINENRVWERKKEARQRYRFNWYGHLQKGLEREGWSQEFFDLLVNSKTPRALAIHLAARHLRVSYDAVARACRRAAKAAKK